MLTERTYAPEYAPRREFKVNPAQKARRNVKVEFDNRAKRQTITGIIVVGMFFVFMVVAAAFASNLAYTNNQLKKDNKAIANEIQTLKIEIKSSGNIGSIEKEASEKLGMIYPTGSQFVEVDKIENKTENFAAVLKEEAFN